MEQVAACFSDDDEEEEDVKVTARHTNGFHNETTHETKKAKTEESVTTDEGSDSSDDEQEEISSKKPLDTDNDDEPAVRTKIQPRRSSKDIPKQYNCQITRTSGLGSAPKRPKPITPKVREAPKPSTANRNSNIRKPTRREQVSALVGELLAALPQAVKDSFPETTNELNIGDMVITEDDANAHLEYVRINLLRTVANVHSTFSTNKTYTALDFMMLTLSFCSFSNDSYGFVFHFINRCVFDCNPKAVVQSLSWMRGRERNIESY